MFPLLAINVKIPLPPELLDSLKTFKDGFSKLVQKLDKLWYDGFIQGGLTVGVALIVLYLLFHRKG